MPGARLAPRLETARHGRCACSMWRRGEMTTMDSRGDGLCTGYWPSSQLGGWAMPRMHVVGASTSPVGAGRPAWHGRCGQKSVGTLRDENDEPEGAERNRPHAHGPHNASAGQDLTRAGIECGAAVHLPEVLTLEDVLTVLNRGCQSGRSASPEEDHQIDLLVISCCSSSSAGRRHSSMPARSGTGTFCRWLCTRQRRCPWSSRSPRSA